MDEWGAIRAGKGLYISTDIREKAEKKQLDLEESIVQLEQALALAREL
ncbi:type VI secretion system Vgr family protein, partial [Ignatzschineria larvae]